MRRHEQRSQCRDRRAARLPFGCGGGLRGDRQRAGSCTVDRSNVTCQLGTLASGASLSFDVVVRPRRAATCPSARRRHGDDRRIRTPRTMRRSCRRRSRRRRARSLVTNTNESGPGSLRRRCRRERRRPARHDHVQHSRRRRAHDRARRKRATCQRSTRRSSSTARRSPATRALPLIEISGATGNADERPVLNAGNSIVRGLAINGFDLNGILVHRDAGRQPVRSELRSAPTRPGTAAVPNQGRHRVNAPNNTIGGVALGGRQPALRQRAVRRRHLLHRQHPAAERDRDRRHADQPARQRPPGRLHPGIRTTTSAASRPASATSSRSTASPAFSSTPAPATRSSTTPSTRTARSGSISRRRA